MVTARLDPRLATAPLVAALASLAAAVLIAAVLMGPNLTTDPWDIPALVQPPGGDGAPIVLDVGAAVEALAVGASVGVDDLQPPTSGFFGATEPSSDDGRAITAIRHEGRTDPAPRDDSMVDYVRKRISEMVGEPVSYLKQRDGARRESRDQVERVVEQVAPQVTETVTKVEETVDEIPAPDVAESLVPDPDLDTSRDTGGGTPEGTVPPLENEVQPDLSTDAGSSSPLV